MLSNRIAVVTGASRGLGRAMAESLSREGARVALVGRVRETLDAVAAEVRGAEAFVADVSKEEDVLRLAANVEQRMGKAHILINNAGIALRKNITDITLDEWQGVQNANLTSAFLMSRAFIPQMKSAGWGRIIHIASIMSHVALPQRAAYASSKAAMLGLTRATALELAKENITVNAICPGWFSTEMTDSLQKNAETNAQIVAKIPMGRWGQPEEIGALAAYLCSDAAGFITGTDVTIDGGWCAA
jgi:NAD(P)-dependent dehydrogenase (short-subunit alcohol dehydrogenase family)